MKTWADTARVVPPALNIDRDAGEGPPRCCARGKVAADALIWYGELPVTIRSKVLARFPKLVNVPTSGLYLCDACAETLVRERVITREERAVGLGLAADRVAAARAHDLLFKPPQ